MPPIQRIRTGPTKNQIIGQSIAGASRTLGRGIADYGQQKAKTEELATRRSELAEKQTARDARENKDDLTRWVKLAASAKNKDQLDMFLKLGRSQKFDIDYPDVFNQAANPDVKFGSTFDDQKDKAVSDYDRLIKTATATKENIYDKTTEIVKRHARNPEEARKMRQIFDYEINLKYDLPPAEDKTDWEDFYGVVKPPLPGQPGGPEGPPAPDPEPVPTGKPAGDGVGGGILSRARDFLGGLAGSGESTGLPPGITGGSPLTVSRRPRPGGADLSPIARGSTNDQRAPVGGAFGVTGPEPGPEQPGGIAAGAAPGPIDVESQNEVMLMNAMQNPIYKHLQAGIKAQREQNYSWTEIAAWLKQTLPTAYEQMTTATQNNTTAQ